MPPKKKPNPTPNPLQVIKDKFKKLKELQAQINKMKDIYQKHDQLVEELMPMFIEVQADRFIINREIKIGTQKYRLTPHFYDEKKAKAMAKVWKSTAFSSVTIE